MPEVGKTAEKGKLGSGSGIVASSRRRQSPPEVIGRFWRETRLLYVVNPRSRRLEVG